MKKSSLIPLLLSSASLFAEPDYQVIADIDFSPYSGAEDLLTIQHTMLWTEDDLIDRPPSIRSFPRGIGRFFELLAWDVIDTYIMVAQHEVFGHGYRIRDLGSHYAKVEKYTFAWDGAATHLSITDNLTTSQVCAISIAGVEATAILANRTRLKWLEAGKIDGRQSTLYTSSEQDLTNYARSLDRNDLLEPTPGGHDIRNYLFFLQVTYPEGHLTKSELRKRVLINYLDPFTFYAYYAWFKFIVNGKPFEFPMIPIGKYRYLPSLRLGLTPFGPEYFVENFLLREGRPIYFYLKGGRYAGNDYYGFGVEQPYLLHWKGVSIGYRLDAWRQPRVLFQKGALQVFQLEDVSGASSVPPLYSPGTLDKKIVGMAFSLILEKEIEESNFSLYFQPGFKTVGFLPGEALRAAPIVRGGLSMRY